MGAGFITTWFSLHYRTITSRGDSPFALSHSVVEPDGGQTNLPQVPPQGPRFQFSLATLMAVVTGVSVLCALAAWLGPLFIVLCILAIGPVGGTIIVRRRKSAHYWAVSVWSGVVNVVLCGIMAFCGGLAALLAAGPSASLEVIVIFVFSTASVVPFAFVIGVLSSIVWEVAAGVTRETWRMIVKRCGAEAPREGE